MDKQMEIKLVNEAKNARELAYAPYSNYSVGAALLTKDGKIYKGGNIESASFTPSNCAERTAFFKAISSGDREFEAIAVASGKIGEEVKGLFPPCGVCRQVMMEFCNPKTFKIIMADKEEDYKVVTLEELLPYGFGPDNI